MNTTATAMSGLESLLAQPLVHAVGWALVHFVWQGVAVAAIVAMLLAGLRRASANVRYLVACVALLVLACMPIATAWYVFPQPPTHPMLSDAQADNLPFSSATGAGKTGTPQPQVFVEYAADPDSLPVATTPIVNPSLPPERSLHTRAAAWIERALPWLVAVWLIGVLGLSARLSAGWAQVQRMRHRHARPAADPWPARLAELARRLRVTRPVRLLESAIVEVPIVIGWLRPVILLPASALLGLTPHQLEALLAHELAHIRRQDYLVNLLQTLVETLLFYHPAVWWISRRIRAEREECCDDLAVSVCGDRVVYARALASMEEIRGTRPQLGVAADGGPLLARIRRLVGVPAPQASRSAWWLVAAVALAVTVALGAGMRLSTSVSQAQGSEPRQDNEAVEQGLMYTGQVTDHDTGQPIESATVVVRQMLVRVEPENIGKVLAESKHQTDADGKYSFAIRPEHAAKPLYIKIDVQNPKYAALLGHGYSLDMIRRNQQLGDPPFFAAIRLRQAAEIHGQVVTPDGEPAAGVRVLALTKLEINEPARNSEMLRTQGSTDDQGRFRLMPSKDGRLLIYLESNNYSPLTKLVDGRGDLGRFTLQEGITLKGRLLDAAGQPLPARWVVARRKQDASVLADQNLDEARQDFYFQVSRSALTDDQGEYALAPVAAGAYSVTPTELSEQWFDFEMRPRPLSAVFYPRDVTLIAGAAPDPLDFRAVPHATVEVQCVNSKDEPQPGQEISIQGGGVELNQPFVWNGTGITDSAGKVRLLVPRGLEGIGLYTIDNEHHAVTFQRTKDSPPVPGNLKLGTVHEDVTGIILRRLASPIVLIKVSDAAGAPLGNVEIRVSNRSYTCWIEKHGDGWFRTASLMPDAEATITVKAPGYQTRTENVTLPEKAVKELDVVLQKTGFSQESSVPGGGVAGVESSSPQPDSVATSKPAGGSQTRPQPPDRETDKDVRPAESDDRHGTLTKILAHESRIPVRAKFLVVQRDWSNTDDKKPQDGIQKTLSELPDGPVSRAAREHLAKSGSLGPDVLFSSDGLPSVFGSEDFANLQSWLREQGLLLGELPVEQQAEPRTEERWKSSIDLSLARVPEVSGKWWLVADVRAAFTRPDEEGDWRVVDHPYYLANIKISRTQQVMERRPGGPFLRGAAIGTTQKFSFYLPKRRVVAVDWDALYKRLANQPNQASRARVILVFEDAATPEPRSTMTAFRLPQRIGSLYLDDDRRWLSPPDDLARIGRTPSVAHP